MGAKITKQESFSRTPSFRRSQRNTFQKIEKKLEKVSKDIEEFSGTTADPKYLKIKKNLTDIINSLDKISSSVKDKHMDIYQDLLNKCNDELEKVEDKVQAVPEGQSDQTSAAQGPSVVDSPLSERSSQSVEIKLVKFAVDGNTADGKKGKKKSRRKSAVEEAPSTSHEETEEEKLQLNNINKIDEMRKQIEYLEHEINMYKEGKGEKDKTLFMYIKDSLVKVVVSLDNLETFGNVQIKHERKLALQRAQDSLKYLNDDTAYIPKPKPRKQSIDVFQSIESDEFVNENKSSKQVTFEINADDNLGDELYKILNDKLADAAKETVTHLVSTSATGSNETTFEQGITSKDVKEIGNFQASNTDFENFDNTESEDDFDFVDVETENEKTKSTPVLVTSF